jgi:hypothetical protein
MMDSHRQVLVHGLQRPFELPESWAHDSVTSACVIRGDQEWCGGGGAATLLLGTYGQQLLAYRLEWMLSPADEEKLPPQATTSASSASASATPAPLAASALVPLPEFRLLWRRRFPAPVYGVVPLDLSGDGMREIVVLTMHSIHVLQQDVESVGGGSCSSPYNLCTSIAV